MVVSIGREVGKYTEGIHVVLKSRGLCSIFEHRVGGVLDSNSEGGLLP